MDYALLCNAADRKKNKSHKSNFEKLYVKQLED